MRTSEIVDPRWLDDMLSENGLCRFATMKADRGPHVTPVGFLWDGEAVWIASQTRTQRFVDVGRDARCALIVEGPDPMVDGYVEILGRAEVVGRVPCEPADTDELHAVEALWNEKLGFPLDLVYDGLHAWLKVTPTKIIRVRSVIAHHDDEAYVEGSKQSIRHRETR